MFNFTFASDFFHSKTTFHSMLVIGGAAIALATHQIGLMPFLATVAATLHVTFLRDTLAKLGELDAEVAGSEAPPTGKSA